ARGGKEGKTPLEPAVQDSRQTEVTAIPMLSVLKSGFSVGESGKSLSLFGSVLVARGSGRSGDNSCFANQ
ncbi:MAG: hypothetical protein IIY80_02805, partial [Aeriscardovia sp.]|nr:hypothetical protein [Aeriscardovia sp.]